MDQLTDFRRRWYRAHVKRFEADSEAVENADRKQAVFRRSAPAAISLRDELSRSGNLDAFVRDMQAWAPSAHGFNAFSGQMFLNQIGKKADDPRAIASLLVDVLTAPGDGADAVHRIDELVATVRRIGTGSNPSPGYSGFLASYFWALQDQARWPVAWASALEFAEYCAGRLPPTTHPARRYHRYLEIAAELDNNFTRFEQVARWWKDTQPAPAFLDAVLVDRCRFNKQFDGEMRPEIRENVLALIAIFNHLGEALLDSVAAAAGLELKYVKHMQRSADQLVEANMWVDWRLPVEGVSPTLRIWVTDQGTIIGLRSGVGRRRPDWIKVLAEIVEPLQLAEFELIRAKGSSHSSTRAITGAPGEFIYGKWYEPEALADLDLRAEVVSVTEALRPTLDRIVELAGGDGSVPQAASHSSLVEATDAEDLPKEAQGLPEEEAQGLPEEAESYPEEAEASLDERIENLAEELLLEERGFLDDIVRLLRDKGQVILYGPPGTGKTYLARKLAQTLAPQSDRRMLVQFHPSTSYEDFFEGYRPETGPDGAMAYRLIPGPLARLAEQAAAAPGQRFVMVIDEINRANLPKVLGELLFLFEYRNEQVQTLYRPGAPFTLPKNLWFIGTMNTADRSIALIDAALRRRFHFVPFFPDRGPTVGLLERWLRAEREPEWVGVLVDMVNDELAEDLSGSHLLLGPSHFMKKGLNREKLRRIWEYNIEPFIEDQFFGDPARIKQFRFEDVMKRFHDLGGDTGEPAEDSAVSPPRTTPDETEGDSSVE